MLGLPFDDKSTFMKGSAKAPALIRKYLHDGASNYMSENGIDIEKDIELKDFGDLNISDYHQIEHQISEKIDLSLSSIFLGGDHSLSYPILKAIKKVHPKIDLLHFDAHADTYHNFEGDPFSHACPFARVMEDGLVVRMISVGIRNMSKHLLEQSAKFGIETIMMKDVGQIKSFNFTNPLYISIDMDAFDPAFAPGVSHYEPGGFSSRDFINLLNKIKSPVLGADIVELNPDRDPLEITATLAAKLVKELCGLIIRNN